MAKNKGAVCVSSYRSDYTTLLKELDPRKRGNSFSLLCPSCHKREAFIYEKGHVITCNRLNKCGYEKSLFEYIKDREGLTENKDVFKFLGSEFTPYYKSSPKNKRSELENNQTEIQNQSDRKEDACAIWELSKPITTTINETTTETIAKKYFNNKSISSPVSIAKEYFINRDIPGTVNPDFFRYLPQYTNFKGKYYNGEKDKGKKIHATNPAIFSKAVDFVGNTTGMQLTYFDKNTKQRLYKLSYGLIKGAACRIQTGSNDTLILAEGVETALTAAMANPEASIWATFGVGNFINQRPLKGIKKVVLVSDGQTKINEAGKEARDFIDLYKAANQFHKDYDVFIINPAPPVDFFIKGFDLNDILTNNKKDLCLLKHGLGEVKKVVTSPIPYTPATPTARNKSIAVETIDTSLKRWFDTIELQTKAKDYKKKLKMRCHGIIDKDPSLDPEKCRRKKISVSLKITHRIKKHWGKNIFTPAPPHQFKAPAGSGKTTQTIKEIQRRPWFNDKSVHLKQPTLRMQKEVVKKGGDRFKVVEGRNERMCDRYELTSDIYKAGLSIENTLCKRDGGFPVATSCLKCPAYFGCGYQKQKRDLKANPTGVFCMSHEYLTAHSPASTPHLLIVDEKHFKTLAGKFSLDLSELTNHRNYVPQLADAYADYREVVKEIRDCFEQYPETYLDEIRKRGYTDKESFTPVIEYLHKARNFFAFKEIHPAMSGGAIENLLKKHKPSQISKLLKLCKALSKAIETPDKNSQQIVITKDHNGKDIVTHYYLKENTVPKDTPTLLLDASASTIINKAIWGKDLETTEINIERNAVIIQVTGKGFSNQSITGKFKNGEPCRPAAAERLRAEIVSFIKTKAKDKKLLIVTTKAIEEVLKHRIKHIPDTAIEHYENIQGIDIYKDFDVVIAIGRLLLPIDKGENLARSIYANDPNPLQFIEETKNEKTGTLEKKYPLETRTHRMKDGTIKEEEVEVHPEPRTQAVIEQFREHGILQAIDRLRLIHNPIPKEVFILSKIPLNIEIDQATSWHNLIAGGSRIDLAFEKTGVIPLGFKALAKWYPEIWKSERQARSDLEKHLKPAVTLSDKGAKHQIVYSIWKNAPLYVAEIRQKGQCGSTTCVVINGNCKNPRALVESVTGSELQSFKIIEYPNNVVELETYKDVERVVRQTIDGKVTKKYAFAIQGSKLQGNDPPQEDVLFPPQNDVLFPPLDDVVFPPQDDVVDWPALLRNLKKNQ